ncbi:hypothetical protein GCM10022403_074650 [Streptomyces coacervatus]|uniref:Uncharacterized protein n=1 Tax=Streptomyces coacervatus TaxID=647381 RepID=A0ABP7IZD1_9ACTN|nr:hypothetical protein [Streptomyces coacervatus]MDF2270102.1 hypothetical protein [Streptomyces coacervatus]
MAEVEELLDEVTVHMPSAAQLRARGDRRLARRRSGAVAAAVVAVAGAVTLAVLPGNGTHETRPAKGPTASQSAPSQSTAVGNTPYKKHGVVDLKAPNALPLYGQWNWRGGDKEIDGLTLGWVGGCSAVDQVLLRSSGPWTYDTFFEGDRGAKASHRYTEYDGQSDLTTALSQLREALSGCGLTSQGAATGSQGRTVETYTGTVEHRVARIVVEYGTRWLSVVQESGGTPRS